MRIQAVIRFEMPDDEFLVRGLQAGCVALLVAIASNLVTHLTALAS